MSVSNASTTPAPAADSTSDEMAAKVVQKSIKGKGAWYWAHLEPILLNNSDTALPKAVKLKCSLCDALFSASNPSRTATEHLKRRTCPNFASSPKSISSVPSSSSRHQPPVLSHRKGSSNRRSGNSGDTVTTTTTMTTSFSFHQVVQPLTVLHPSRVTVDLSSTPTDSKASTSAVFSSAGESGCGFYNHRQQEFVLSGGKEDLGALAQLEDTVKRLKSPKPSSIATTTLTRAQADSALNFLAVRLIFLHATSSCTVFKCNRSWIRAHYNSRVGTDTAHKLAFIHAKMEKWELNGGGDDKETGLFALPNGSDDDGLNEVYIDAFST